MKSAAYVYLGSVVFSLLLNAPSFAQARTQACNRLEQLVGTLQRAPIQDGYTYQFHSPHPTPVEFQYNNADLKGIGTIKYDYSGSGETLTVTLEDPTLLQQRFARCEYLDKITGQAAKDAMPFYLHLDASEISE